MSVYFSLTLEPKLKLINAKYTDIYRIIMNLTANAVEAINGAGSISITSRFISEKDCLLIEILDRKMPVMDGLECIAEIRKRQIAVPIILASGSQTENLEMLSFLKIDHTLNKPYNFEEMLSVIEELIP